MAKVIDNEFPGWVGWCHHCGTLQPFEAAHVRQYTNGAGWPDSWRCAATDGFDAGCGEPWGLGVWPVIAPEFVTAEVAAIAVKLPVGWSDNEFGDAVHLAWFATEFAEDCANGNP